MNSTIVKDNIQNNDEQLSILIETISNWPDWKIKSICIDQSDIALLKQIGILKDA